MNQQSEEAVTREAGLSMVWPTLRNLTLSINAEARRMGVTKPKLEIGNGNEVVWEVGSLPGYTVEIELGTNVDPSSLAQRAGTTQVRGNLQLSSSAPSGGQVEMAYSVFLRKTRDHSRIQLEHVGSPLAPSLTSLPGPFLVIDRMGDPGDPDMGPPPAPKTGGSPI